MVLIVQGTKEEEEFFDWLAQKILGKHFGFFEQVNPFGKHLSYSCGHSSYVGTKGCDFFQTLIGGWSKKCLKQCDFPTL
jgi:hypothetical protein